MYFSSSTPYFCHFNIILKNQRENFKKIDTSAKWNESNNFYDANKFYANHSTNNIYFV